MKRSKQYKELKKMLVEKDKGYIPLEGLDLLQKISKKRNCTFEESVDLAINLNLKKKYSIRETIILPYTGFLKKKNILVFANGNKLEEAEKAGATYCGAENLIERIQKGWLDFDVVIATPDMMKQIGKLGSILGRRGLMPNVKLGTVTFDIKGAVEEFNKGKIAFKSDKMGTIHVKIGHVGMSQNELLENLKALYRKTIKSKPAALKGNYVKNLFLSSTMGFGLKINYYNL